MRHHLLELGGRKLGENLILGGLLGRAHFLRREIEATAGCHNDLGFGPRGSQTRRSPKAIWKWELLTCYNCEWCAAVRFPGSLHRFVRVHSDESGESMKCSGCSVMTRFRLHNQPQKTLRS